MNSFALYNKISPETTQVSNLFIDKYMPAANGSFVKVYLFLLRQASSSHQTECSITYMADLLENTEADILRAFRYWERIGLIEFYTDSDGNMKELRLLPITDLVASAPNSSETISIRSNTTPTAPEQPDTASQETAATSTGEIPSMPQYDPMELTVLSEDEEIKTTINIIETMMGTPMTEQYLRLIVYFMSELGFSLELTSFVFETALSKGKKAPRYIEKIALDWASKKIKNVSEAEAEASHFNTLYNLVRNHMGIEHMLTPVERSIIDGWQKYNFTETIIAEACKRTILNTGKPGLNYAGKILERWHQAGVKRISDIQKLDKSHKTPTTKKQPSNNRFQNFPQRNYSEQQYQDLEKQLLNK